MNNSKQSRSRQRNKRRRLQINANDKTKLAVRLATIHRTKGEDGLRAHFEKMKTFNQVVDIETYNACEPAIQSIINNAFPVSVFANAQASEEKAEEKANDAYDVSTDEEHRNNGVQESDAAEQVPFQVEYNVSTR